MSLVPADLRCHALLNEIYCEPKRGVEVGVYRGDLSWRMLASNKNLFLYMVDSWKESTEGDTYLTTVDHINRFSQDDHNRVMQIAVNAVSPFIGRYEILRMRSDEAAKCFEGGSLDFVFIDADHSYEGCSQDIALWYPKLKKGGLLSGHDYRDERNYGVIRAVTEFCKSTGHIHRTGANYTWFVTK